MSCLNMKKWKNFHADRKKLDVRSISCTCIKLLIYKLSTLRKLTFVALSLDT